MQQDVIKDHEHLRGAVIPVQDLHVTLFVVTLREEDGSLEVRRYPSSLPPFSGPVAGVIHAPSNGAPQASISFFRSSRCFRPGPVISFRKPVKRARQTLEGCSDIIEELELAPGSTGSCGGLLSPDVEGAGANSEEEQSVSASFPSSQPSYVERNVGETGDGSHSLAGEDNTEAAPAVGKRAETPTSEGNSIGEIDGLKQDPVPPSNRPPSRGSHGRAHAVDRGTPLTLAFEGLATFGNKVLYARLVEDDEANRFRRLTSALHERFVRASLVKHHDESSTKKDATSGDTAVHTFDFVPHLTVLKTSKLKRKRMVIPKGSYGKHVDCFLGSHSPTAIELSSMMEREDSGVPEGWEPGEGRPYYKCEGKLALRANADVDAP